MKAVEDPGWGRSLRAMWWWSIPFVGSIARIRRRRATDDQLVDLRSTFLGNAASLLWFLVAFSFIEPWNSGPEAWIVWTVPAIGSVSVVCVYLVRRRRLAASSPEALAKSYQASMFIGIGMADAAWAWGLVGVLLSNSLWIYLLALPFALVGLALIAPSKADIERRQREIAASGSSLSLLTALQSTPLGRVRW